MYKEISRIPEIELEKINPQSRLSEREKIAKKKRREELLEQEIILRKGSPTEKKFERCSKRIRERFAGTCHGHSVRSTRIETGHAEGIYTIEEMLKYYEKLGMEFGAFTEHVLPSNPTYQGENSEICKDLLKEANEITELNKKREGAFGLSGVEADIMYDETEKKFKMDVPDGVLGKMDIAAASTHSMPYDNKVVAKNIDNYIEKNVNLIEKRIMMAIENKNISIIAHPDRYTRYNEKELEQWKKEKNKTTKDYWHQEYWPMWERIIKAMEDNNKAFEINMNSLPGREMWDILAKAKVKIFINFDAHDFENKKDSLKAPIKKKIKEGIELTAEENEKKKLWEEYEKAIGNWGVGKETEEDMKKIEEHKQDGLTSGPGFATIRALMIIFKKMDKKGISPDRIVNSSLEKLLTFLIDDNEKETENLMNLRKKMNEKKVAL